MAISRSTLTPVPQPAADAASDAGSSPAERQQILALAQEFESMLLVQMIREMRRSMLDETSDSEGLGNQTMTETVDVELAQALSRQGGIGFAKMVGQALEGFVARSRSGQGPVTVDGAAPATTANRHEAAVPAASMPAIAPVAASSRARKPAPAAATSPRADPGGGALQGSTNGEEQPRERPSLAMPLDTTVTSPFGWRSDPFHGRSRFHAGVDLRAAYGVPVPSAASGRVVFAGEQGAYGQTVVVEHENGVRSRYAHLSAVHVQAGQELAAGDVVGRVGRSGRATGPHLHFEVTVDGARVDPAVVSSRIPGGFKLVDRDADFPFDRVSSMTRRAE